MDKSFLKDINILYVEDENEVRNLTCSFLSKFINKIISASNGQEGLDLFIKYYEDKTLENIDLVVTDINMPKMNGLEMLEAIGKVDHLIPSIVTTAHNDSSFLREAINQRVRGYVSKPLNMHSLIDNIITVSEPKYLKDRLEILNKELELKVETKTHALKSILDAQDNLILVINEEGSLEVNQTLLDFFGYSIIEELKAKHKCMREFFIPKNNYFISSSDLWYEEIMKLEDNNRVVVMQNSKKEEIIFRVNIKSFMYHTKYTVITFTDITDLKHYTYELQYKATHDNLTKLYNRHKFNDELEKEITRENRYMHGLSLLMIDIDSFKLINDTYGHDIGDIVLKDIANIIQRSTRSTDYVARWGGEEFMVLLPETVLFDASSIGELIRQNVEKHKHTAFERTVTVSIGVSQFKINDDTEETFTKHVDLAMYEAKQTGKNKVVKYEK